MINLAAPDPNTGTLFNVKHRDLYGDYDEFLIEDPEIRDDQNVLPMFFWSMNPWTAMKRAGIVPEDQSLHRYQDVCPYLDQEYFHIVPRAIVTTDATRYNLDNVHSYYRSMAEDGDWNRRMMYKPDEKPSTIERAMMGSGYRDCAMNFDGHGSIHRAALWLENGDHIPSYVWVWYNK